MKNLTLDVLNWKKQKVGTVELESGIIDLDVRKDILQTVVHWQLASRRQGTHMVKTRALVSGGGKKPFKQKGTGNARQGTSRSPLMPGGAKLFGPSPRSYAYSLPKQVRKLGIKMALSHLHREGRLFVVEDLSADGKTKALAANLAGFGVSKALLVDSKVDGLFKRASGNLSSFKYQSVEGVNVFDLLKYDTLLLSRAAVSDLVRKVKVS